MLNSIPYNAGLYNSLAPSTVTESSDVFQFNGFGLQNSNVCVQKVTYSNAPDRDFQKTDAPRYKGQIKNDIQWREKIITFEGYITTDTAAELEQLIDQMKQELSAEDGDLDITAQGWSGTRRFTANLIKTDSMFDKREHFHITFCPFKIQFSCIDPFGYDVDNTVASLLSQSLPVVSQTLTSEGTTFSELYIVLTINSVSGPNFFQIENTETGEIIKIETAFAAGDVLRIDGINKEVTLNGTDVDFDGQLLTLNPGDSTIEITFDGTSVDYDVTFKHKNAYL